MSGQNAGIEPPRVNVAEVLDDAPLSPRALLITILLGLVLVTDGFDLVILGFLAPAVSAELGYSHAEIGWLLSAAHVGVVIGGLVGGRAGDRFGRRPVLLAGILFFGGGTLTCGLAQDASLFIALRFAASLGLGIVAPNIAAYLTEILPLRLRSQFTMLTYMAITVGSLLCGLAATWLLPEPGWRAVFFLGGTAPLLLIPLLLVLLPESPRVQIALRKDSGTIARTLNKICGGQRFSASDVFFVPAPAQTGRPGFAQLFAPKHRATTALLSFLAFLIFFTTIGLQNMGMIVLSAMGVTVEDGIRILMVQSIAGFGGVVAGSFAVRYLAPRMVLVGLLGSGLIGLGLLATLPGVRPETGMLTLLFALCGFGLTSSFMMMFPLAAQAFPTEVRSTGTGVVIAAGRVGSTVGPGIVGSLLALFGSAGAFTTLAGVALVALVVVAAARRRIPGSPQRQGRAGD